MPKFKVYTGPKKGKFIQLPDGRKRYLKSFKPPPRLQLENDTLFVVIRSRDLRSKKKKLRRRSRRYRTPRRRKSRRRTYKTRSLRRHKRKKIKTPVRQEIKDYEKIINQYEKYWKKIKPRTKKERDDLLNVCGDACFMDQFNTNDYSVCQKCDRNACFCYPDCYGLLHVARKAAKDNNYAAAFLAHSLAQDLGCDWKEALMVLEAKAHL